MNPIYFVIQTKIIKADLWQLFSTSIYCMCLHFQSKNLGCLKPAKLLWKRKCTLKTTVATQLKDDVFFVFLNFWFWKKNNFADFFWYQKNLQIFKKYWTDTIQESCTKKVQFCTRRRKSHFFFTHSVQKISGKCLNESVESNLLDYTVAAAFYFGASFDTTADLILNERTWKVTISV